MPQGRPRLPAFSSSGGPSGLGVHPCVSDVEAPLKIFQPASVFSRRKNRCRSD